jgi:hypothetical protein
VRPGVRIPRGDDVALAPAGQRAATEVRRGLEVSGHEDIPRGIHGDRLQVVVRNAAKASGPAQRAIVDGVLGDERIRAAAGADRRTVAKVDGTA